MSANSARASTASSGPRAARNAQRLARGQRSQGGSAPPRCSCSTASASRELADAIAQADALLISAAPAEGRDPVLAALESEIARAPRLRSVVYLSTLGVYGDSGGAWIDETARRPCPRSSPPRRARIDAERAWQALGGRRNLPSRSCGSAASTVRDRTGWCGSCAARRIASPSRATCRTASMSTTSRRRSMRHSRGAPTACSTLSTTSRHRRATRSLSPPAPRDRSAAGNPFYAEAATLLSPLALSFYEGCIRARNDKLKIGARRDAALPDLPRGPARAPRGRRSFRRRRARCVRLERRTAAYPHPDSERERN